MFADFFRSRWLGEVPLDRLFWRDMMLVGTGINVASSAVALVLLGLKMPLGLVLVVVAPTARARIALMVYSLSLVALLGVSALYHRITWRSLAARDWMR